MKADTLRNLITLFVNVPLMIDSSKKQKNKYLKGAMAIGGAAIAVIIVTQLLKKADDKQQLKRGTLKNVGN